MKKFLVVIITLLLVASCSQKKIDLAPSKIVESDSNETAIIFVHGLTGNAVETWTNKESQLYFPKALSEDKKLEGIDIFAINYYAETFENNLTLKELGINFNIELRSLGIFDKCRYKNLIFVCHSLGNLVVRSALYTEPNKYSQVTIPLIIAITPPSSGSNLAALLGAFQPQNQMLKNLSPENKFIRDLNTSWEKNKGDTQISCAYETIPYKNYGIVVDQVSASSICTNTPWPAISDHSSITKPSNINDRVYKWVRDEILLALNSKMLSSKINFKNVYANVRHVPKVKEKKAKSTHQSHQTTVTAYELFQSLDFINKFDRDKLIIKAIPKINGGVSCNDYAAILQKAWHMDVDKIVKKTAHYVRRPFSKDCFRKISSVAWQMDAADVIEDMINSKPKY